MGLEPDKPYRSGNITAKKVYELFHSVRKLYAKADANWALSGMHRNDDFADYCNHEPQALYLHNWLQRLGNPNLTASYEERNSIEGGFTVSNAVSVSAPSSVSSSSIQNSGLKRDERFLEVF